MANKVINFPSDPNQNPDAAGEVKVPTPEEAAKEFKEYNSGWIKMIREDVKIESAQYKHMLELNGQETRHLEDDLEDIAVLMLESARNRIEKSFGGMGRVDSVLGVYMRYLNAIFSQQCLSPIYGTENEWEDITDPKDAENGQVFKTVINGQTVEIPFNKLEVNKRMRSIFRLNGDNRFAHRTDFVAFVDPAKPNETHLNDDSIRFITFPYEAETLTCHCTFADGKVDQYLSCTEDYIKNNIVFPAPDADLSNPQTYDHYIICPKIPEHLFEQYGINKDAMIEQYLREVEAEYQSRLAQMQGGFPIADAGEAPVDPAVDGSSDPDAELTESEEE